MKSDASKFRNFREGTPDFAPIAPPNDRPACPVKGCLDPEIFTFAIAKIRL
jgi:hypothetical protein